MSHEAALRELLGVQEKCVRCGAPATRVSIGGVSYACDDHGYHGNHLMHSDRYCANAVRGAVAALAGSSEPEIVWTEKARDIWTGSTGDVQGTLYGLGLDELRWNWQVVCYGGKFHLQAANTSAGSFDGARQEATSVMRSIFKAANS